MTVSVAVMAHPKRERWVPGIVAKLDADATVVWDQINDRWDTGRRSLMAHDPDATHHLVVQDDAILCCDLVAGLTEAVKFSGPHPVCCYMGRVRPNQDITDKAVRKAKQSGTPWAQMPGPWWGVGIMVPVADIAAIVKFGDELTGVKNYDLKISDYYLSVGVECLYTYPSLVEHRNGVDDKGRPNNASLVAGRTGVNRQAHCFVGEDTSALNMDWSKPPARVDVPTHRRRG